MAVRNYLSVCLCFKNSASYLAEWLAFYTVVGVEHFYLYDNDSSDDFLPIVEPYLKAGTATLIRFPGLGRQQAMYLHCLTTYGSRTRWMMFCDDDEFLFPVLDRTLAHALRAYERYAGLAVSWMLYGSAGHETRPPGLVVESFTRRGVAPDVHVKCIVDPIRIVAPLAIGHYFQCVGGAVVVDEHRVPLVGPFRARPSVDLFRVNHYITKSREEMVARRRRVQADTGMLSRLSIEEWFRLEVSWNKVDDPIATRYADRIRQVIRYLGDQASARAVP